MTITEQALADLLKQYFTTLEPVGKDVTLKNEMKKVAQPDGSTKIQMVPTKGDLYIPEDLSNSMAKAIAKAIHPNLTTTGGFDWNYFSSVLPTGIDPSALVGLYQFDGTSDSLKDRSSNGHHLAVSANESYCGLPVSNLNGTLAMMAFAEDKYLKLANTAHEPAFQMLGAMVIEVVFVCEGNTGTSDTLVACTPAVDSDSDGNLSNHLYRLQIYQNDSRWFYFHETGSGVNQGFYAGYCYPGGLQQVTLIRSAAGVIQVIQNGFKVGESTLVNPTGGSKSLFRIGAQGDGSSPLNGAVASVRVLNGVTYSQAQWEESYRRVRGIIT